jgi:hypothetical protein
VISITQPVIEAIEQGRFAFALGLYHEMHQTSGYCETCPLKDSPKPYTVCACRLEAELLNMSLIHMDSNGLELSRKLKNWREYPPVFNTEGNIKALSIMAIAIAETSDKRA